MGGVLKWGLGAAAIIGVCYFGYDYWSSRPSRPALSPSLAAVAAAETENQHFGADGNVIIGSKGEIGRFQIMPIHIQKGEVCEGMNLHDEAQNLACAEKLEAKQGLIPWFSSMSRWAPLLRNQEYVLARLPIFPSGPSTAITLPQLRLKVVWSVPENDNLWVIINGEFWLKGGQNFDQWCEEMRVPAVGMKKVQFQAEHTPTVVEVRVLGS